MQSVIKNSDNVTILPYPLSGDATILPYPFPISDSIPSSTSKSSMRRFRTETTTTYRVPATFENIELAIETLGLNVEAALKDGRYHNALLLIENFEASWNKTMCNQLVAYIQKEAPFQSPHLRPAIELLSDAMIKEGKAYFLALLKNKDALTVSVDGFEKLGQALEEALKLAEEIYRNNLKGREFGKEAAQIFVSGARDIAGGKDRSEDQKYAAKLTQPKTDSSGCFGIPGFNDDYDVNPQKVQDIRDSIHAVHDLFTGHLKLALQMKEDAASDLRAFYSIYERLYNEDDDLQVPFMIQVLEKKFGIPIICAATNVDETDPKSLFLAGRYEEAHKLYEDALAMVDSSCDYCFDSDTCRAMCLAMVGKYEEAINSYPNRFGNIADFEATVYFLKGDLEKAKQKALEAGVEGYLMLLTIQGLRK